MTREDGDDDAGDGGRCHSSRSVSPPAGAAGGIRYVMMITVSRSPLWVYPSISSPSFPGASQSTGHDLLGGHPAKAVGGEGGSSSPSSRCSSRSSSAL